MKKSFLTKTILSSYHKELAKTYLSNPSILTQSDYDDLPNTLNKLVEECQDVNEMAKKFDDLTQYKLLHEAFMREKAELTNKSLSTIKIIIVIYFICSLALFGQLYDLYKHFGS